MSQIYQAIFYDGEVSERYTSFDRLKRCNAFRMDRLYRIISGINVSELRAGIIEARRELKLQEQKKLQRLAC